jgi:hypothetical protein
MMVLLTGVDGDCCPGRLGSPLPPLAAEAYGPPPRFLLDLLEEQ